MKEGRFRPSFPSPNAKPRDGLCASMKEGRFRPSFTGDIRVGSDGRVGLNEGGSVPTLVLPRSPGRSGRPPRLNEGGSVPTLVPTGSSGGVLRRADASMKEGRFRPSFPAEAPTFDILTVCLNEGGSVPTLVRVRGGASLPPVFGLNEGGSVPTLVLDSRSR